MRSDDKNYDAKLDDLVKRTHPPLLLSVLKGELLVAWMERDNAQSARVAHSIERNERPLREFVQDLHDKGLRFDLNPTMDCGTIDVLWGGFLDYIKRMDESIRERAAMALESAPPSTTEHHAELRRMRDRIERLRGLCKTAVGYLRDADDYKQADEVAALIGDMEPPIVAESATRRPFGPEKCEAPTLGGVTLSGSTNGEWYCHGCGANQGEPRCKYRKSVPPGSVESRDA